MSQHDLAKLDMAAGLIGGLSMLGGTIASWRHPLRESREGGVPCGSARAC